MNAARWFRCVAAALVAAVALTTTTHAAASAGSASSAKTTSSAAATSSSSSFIEFRSVKGKLLANNEAFYIKGINWFGFGTTPVYSICLSRVCGRRCCT